MSRPIYLTIDKGVSLVVDLERNEAKLFAGLLSETYRFTRDIVIQDIQDIKDNYKRRKGEKMKKIDISGFDPCDDGRDYYASCSSFEEAWEKCPRGDWMLWTAFKLGVDKRTLTLAKGLCANTVRHLMKDYRSIKAVDAAIAYGEGRIDKKELKKAAKNALDASWGAAAAADAAWAAVRLDYWPLAEASAAAASAASAASAADWAAKHVSDVAKATSDAAKGAAAAVAANVIAYVETFRAEHLKLTAGICRKILTDKVLEKINPEV